MTKAGKGWVRMPTERFYHLPEEKKRLIQEAVIQEFSRVPLDKVSINKILKSAEISRGSFYTYFRDKEDAFQFVFEDFVEQIQLYCKEAIIKMSGDFWALPEKLLEYVLDACDKHKMITLAQNAVGHQGLMKMLENKAFCMPLKETKNRWLKEVYMSTDCSQLRVESFEDFQILFSLCVNILVEAMGEIYHAGETRERAKESFLKRLNLIKYGAFCAEPMKKDRKEAEKAAGSKE